jgi:steroid delta-isomerase-like uncharacterized protein
MATTVKARKDSPTAVAREAFRLANEHDAEALRPLLADDIVHNVVPIGIRRGPDAVVAYFRALFAATPDFRVEIDRVAGSRGTVFVKWHATGTFTGDAFLGIEPTGRGIELVGMDCMTIADGRIAENTVVYDGGSFMRQIGMLPRAESRGEQAMLTAFNGVTRARRRFAR